MDRTGFVDPADPEFRRATDAKTRCYYARDLPNPKLTVFPIGEVAASAAARRSADHGQHRGAGPLRPLDHGAAIVMHSTTKYIGGHGTSIGGVVDGGNFDWEKHKDRFPDAEHAGPQLSRRGVDRRQAMGPVALHHQGAVTLLRDLGAPMSPTNAFQFIQGWRRCRWHARALLDNANAVAKHLSATPRSEK